MKNKVMITGAGGYIGSVCCYDFLSRGYEVIAIDNFKHEHKQPFGVI
jgi:UDP-glucose 4-epimerase